MSGRLEGKVAVITGAARGQGRSHAIRLAQEGADIIAVDICEQIGTVPYPLGTAADLEVTVKEVEALDRRIVAHQADVRDFAALKAAFDDGVAQLGRLDIVSANAGIWSHGAAVDLTATAWQDMIDVNLTGVFHTCKAAIPHLVAGGRGGSIILTSSGMGLNGAANIAHYSAAKHGVVGIMRTLAIELAPHSIRVNTVHPGMINTRLMQNDELYRLFCPDIENPTAEDARQRIRDIPMLPIDWLEPVDISNMVLFLASDEGRYVTGTTLMVDAGEHAK
jgi:(+)-trans-carveol dehydrogenase